MAKLIILEGLSRTGKTTISNHLCENGFGRIISLKEKMPEGCDLASFYKGTFYSYDAFFKAFPDETFILDRSFLSEMVFSQFFNRECQISEDYIAEFLDNHDIAMYYLTNTHRDYIKRGPKDRHIYTEQEYMTLDKTFENSLKDIINMLEGCNVIGDFVYTPRDYQLPFLKIDTTENNLYETINLIKQDYETR